MYPVSGEFLQALRGSHKVVVRATAYADASDVTGTPLEVLGGSVKVDGSSMVRRTTDDLEIASLTGRTSDLLDVVSVYGTEVLVERGIEFPTGRREFVPVGRFRVEDVEDSLANPGAVKIKGAGLEARVIDARFPAPLKSWPGYSIVEAIERLIQDAHPSALVEDESGSRDFLQRGVLWERDRWDTAYRLAESIGCDLFADGAGTFRIRPRSTMTSAPVWTVNTGRYGVLLDAQRGRSRSGVYNSVRASSNATDGKAPVAAVVEDDDPTSPTYVEGPFGRVTRYFTSPQIRTVVQARAAARGVLSRSIGSVSTLSLETAVNPALEAGDRIDAHLPDGTFSRHLVDSFSIPLDPAASMTLATRSRAEAPGE